MVLEIADFRVKAGTEEAFAAAVREGLPLLAATPGFVSARLTRTASAVLAGTSAGLCQWLTTGAPPTKSQI